MADLFFLPKVSGLPGAKLDFYRTGTSTPQAVYTDAALDVAHDQPVTADGNGVFAPIYLDPTLPDYRVTYTTSADVLIYTWDDYPSNQNVQQSMRLESTNPFVFLYDTDGTSGSRKYRVRAAGAAFEVQASNEAESVFTTILKFEGNILYSNSTEVAVTSAGSFTGTLTGVSGTITGTINYRIVNNLVTLFMGADLTGTSNSTSMTITGAPVAVRPSFARAVPVTDVTDNTLALCAARAVVQTDGVIAFYIARTDTTANFVRYSATGFTNSGTKGLTVGSTLTYPLN
jgi:hypothetical protein